MQSPPRISLGEMVVLQRIKLKHRKHYGQKIVKDTGIQPGSLYVILHRLEANGHVVSDWESAEDAKGRRCRRFYTITYSGQQRLKESLARLGFSDGSGSIELEKGEEGNGT